MTGGRGRDSPVNLFPVPAAPRGSLLLTPSLIPELMIRVHLSKIGLKALTSGEHKFNGMEEKRGRIF